MLKSKGQRTLKALKEIAYECFGEKDPRVPPVKLSARRQATGRRRKPFELTGTGIPELGTAELPLATPDKVAAFVSGPDMLTSDEMSDQFDVSRETIHQWQESGEIIGVSGGKRGLSFPKCQIGDRGRPLNGIERL